MFSRITFPFILLRKGYEAHGRLRFADDFDVLREDSASEIHVYHLLMRQYVKLNVSILVAYGLLVDGNVTATFSPQVEVEAVSRLELGNLFVVYF